MPPNLSGIRLKPRLRSGRFSGFGNAEQIYATLYLVSLRNFRFESLLNVFVNRKGGSSAIPINYRNQLNRTKKLSAQALPEALTR
jgi:hypothetical protein